MKSLIKKHISYSFLCKFLSSQWVAKVLGPWNEDKLVEIEGIKGYFDHSDLGIIIDVPRTHRQTLTFFPCEEGMLYRDDGRAHPDGVMFARNADSWEKDTFLDTRIAKNVAYSFAMARLRDDVRLYYEDGKETNHDPYGDGSTILNQYGHRSPITENGQEGDSVQDPYSNEGIATDTMGSLS